MLGFSVVTAGPASAAVGTITVDSDSQQNLNGDTVESVVAECPAGSALIGTGWDANSRAVVDEAVPDVAAKTVRAEAWAPDDGTSSPTWSVTAKAICATGVTGVDREHGVSAYDTINTKSATATCDFGKKVVGAGFEIGSFAAGQVHLTSVVPTATTVTVTASEDDTGATESTGANADWAINAYAVCATEPFGLQIVASPSPAYRTDTTTCPANKSVIGAAGFINAAFPDVGISSMSISTYQGTGLAAGSATADRDGTNLAWTMSTTVICAYP
jgi:hypothetical protein